MKTESLLECDIGRRKRSDRKCWCQFFRPAGRIGGGGWEYGVWGSYLCFLRKAGRMMQTEMVFFFISAEHWTGDQASGVWSD